MSFCVLKCRVSADWIETPSLVDIWIFRTDDDQHAELVRVWSDRADNKQKSPVVGPPGFEPGVTRGYTFRQR